MQQDVVQQRQGALAATAAERRVRIEERLQGHKRRYRVEGAIQGILLLCGAISILTTVGIVVVLIEETLGFFRSVSIWEFLTHTRWIPRLGDFGVLPLLWGTLLTTIMAMIVALPVGLASAIYLSEYAAPRVRGVLKPALELLAGVPTVVYGYFALTFMTPLLRGIFGVETVSIYNAASAGIVMGIMIIPLVSSFSEDAMSAVPSSLRQASYGLGATRMETALSVVVPAAMSGIIASFILAVSRAIGETMIVALAAGATPNLTLNPFESVQTMTGYIAQVSGGESAYGTVDYLSIFAIGLTLFVATLLLNFLSRYLVRRFQEVYE